MKPFTYTGLPARVIFGSGTVERLAAELDALGIHRALVLSTPAQQAGGERILHQIGARGAALFSDARMHTPVDVTERAMSQYGQCSADGLVSYGGGSTIGLAKAIALRNDAPHVAVPTTYAGSEMTTILGQTAGGLKTTQKSLRVLPESVIYDVDFTLELPVAMSVTSGINAIAHAVEALYAENANPLLSVLAEQGIGRLMASLPQIIKLPEDRIARADALYGAWLCAVCLGSGGVALHHKLCHVLGGLFDLPHAETHTVVLPHALAFNAPAVPEAMEALRRATGSPEPAAAIYDLARKAGVPVALKDLAMPRSGIDRAVQISLENPYWNPRPITGGGIRAVIEAAWEGERP